jgi:hypothetical protein
MVSMGGGGFFDFSDPQTTLKNDVRAYKNAFFGIFGSKKNYFERKMHRNGVEMI